MFVSWGPDLLVIHNDSYGEILGDRRPALGRPIQEVWHDHWDVIGGYTERVLRGETVYLDAVQRTLRRGGREATAWVTGSYNPIYDEAGQPAGIFGAITSVSEDERAQQLLQESEERFRLIADSAPVPMWVTQLDRTRSFVNQAYVEFLGISYDEAVKFDWRTVLHPDDHDRIIRESVAGEASLQPFVLEARYRSGDKWRWIRSTSQPRWGPDGEHIGFIGVAHDVTDSKEAEAALERRVEERTADLQAALERLQQEVAERERAEEALRQAQKMEAVGQLTGGIAHDFNNLLTPIIGGLEMITRRVEEPRLQRLAQAALDSGRRGAKLATQLLAFSRLQRLAMVPVEVNQVIGEMRRILHHSIGPRITVETALSDHARHALCDANQLENAVLNLALNARDAMPEGGTLTISTGLHREPEETDLAAGDYVCICVTDTGHGMPAQVIARATEPFFSTKPVGKGTGLGLAQVYGVAHQSGGTVRIDSQEGRGTSVRILLPHVPEADCHGPRSEDEAQGVTGARVRGARIMVVDDDPEVLSFLADALGELGHSVDTCPGAEEALRQLDESSPDLMLIDFAMPGCNGAELARQVLVRRPDQRIAFVTGYAESEQIEGALGSDAPVLRKPFSIDELATMIADQLTGQQG